MSNFQFLKQEWPELNESAAKAEAYVLADARTACFYARRSLELAVEWLYAHDSVFKAPYEKSLGALIAEPTFRQNVGQGLHNKAKIIKDLGNQAVHTNRQIRQWDAQQIVTELFHFLFWVARTYTLKSPQDYAGLVFQPALLPKPPEIVIKQSAEQLQKLEAVLKEKDEALAAQAQALADTDAKIAVLQAEIAEAKKKNQAVPDTHDYSEVQTRDLFIDVLLREAGWVFTKVGEDTEYPVKGMPNNSGDGFVDYVLWGDDGLPLGLVEAKKTKHDAHKGQNQAKLYADCLEAKFKQRPIIFYTNGYETWIWDDQNYPPRQVQGFYKKEELQRVIQRRGSRKDPTKEAVNQAVVERYYQLEAIRAVTEEFGGKMRKALVVMATGSGKTRTVVALSELLMRCNWVKRVLFLADRKALVRQACDAFKAHFPESSPVNLVTEKEATGNRVFVCTYPTMMGQIDESQDGQRRFGVGHFDLIVIDEAHRSVYQKYRAIFEYFDALLVGLTATPKDEVDKNTYSLFDLEKGVPTYAYELGQAVDDKFLVPPKPISVPLKFQRDGIRYDDLPEEDKEKWDEIEWSDDGQKPTQVEAEAVNKWLFNEDTVDKVLEHLMTKGLKVAGGDRLGKTIIFAKNHDHALYIQQRFDKNYPHYAGHFARVIDNYEPYADDLLKKFSIPEKPPHIAISVDMLDTGIDVPEVVNLVFFKLVRSKTKFFQMVGRGTRLRKDLFGPGEHKEFFYIFDYCQNLEFFSQNAEGVEGGLQESIAKRLFVGRLELLDRLTKLNAAGELKEQAQNPIEIFRKDLADLLHAEVASMNVENFIVRARRRQVEKFAKRQTWDDLKTSDYYEAAQHLAGLPTEQEQEDEMVKRFDLLMLNLQLAMLKAEPAFKRLRDQVKEIAGRLEEKQSIPMIKEQMPLILDIQTDEYWQDVTLPMLEKARNRLRKLVQFIEKAQRRIVYTNFEDQLGQETEIHIPEFSSGPGSLPQYRKKVLHFLKAHEDHIALKKLKQNEPITARDIQELERLLFETGGIGTREDFEKAFGKQEKLGTFIRSLVGLDREAAKKAFGVFLQGKALTVNQIKFIDLIINYLTQNGVMPPRLLYESPYSDLHPNGLDGVFPDAEADLIVGILKGIEENAAA